MSRSSGGKIKVRSERGARTFIRVHQSPALCSKHVEFMLISVQPARMLCRDNKSYLVVDPAHGPSTKLLRFPLFSSRPQTNFAPPIHSSLHQKSESCLEGKERTVERSEVHSTPAAIVYLFTPCHHRNRTLSVHACISPQKLCRYGELRDQPGIDFQRGFLFRHASILFHPLFSHRLL